MHNLNRRVFFALWPDRRMQHEIWGAFESSEIFSANQALLKQSKLYSVENLHLTLNFLGNVTSGTLECLLTQAANINASSFNLDLNTYGYFQKARVLWVSPEIVPIELTSLHKSLSFLVESCGLQVDKRKFKPHVSLVRKVNFDFNINKGQRLMWKVDAFALVESLPTDNGVVYKPIKVFKLK